MLKLVSTIYVAEATIHAETSFCYSCAKHNSSKGETAERQERRSKGGRAQPPPSLFFLRFPPLEPSS